jgi:hypothetical protein
MPSLSFDPKITSGSSPLSKMSSQGLDDSELRKFRTDSLIP